MKTSKKEQELQAHITELTADLQRQRADFENYRKRVDTEKAQMAEFAKAATVMKLLPAIDTIERAIAHAPADLAENAWVQGITSLTKNLEKTLSELGLSRIDANPSTPFDPNLHEAVSMEDEGGEHELIAEELRAGYRLGDAVIRPSMVRVKK